MYDFRNRRAPNQMAHEMKKATTSTAKYLGIGSCVILSTKRMSQKERKKKQKSLTVA